MSYMTWSGIALTHNLPSSFDGHISFADHQQEGLRCKRLCAGSVIPVLEGCALEGQAGQGGVATS